MTVKTDGSRKRRHSPNKTKATYYAKHRAMRFSNRLFKGAK